MYNSPFLNLSLCTGAGVELQPSAQAEVDAELASMFSPLKLQSETAEPTPEPSVGIPEAAIAAVGGPVSAAPPVDAKPGPRLGAPA